MQNLITRKIKINISQQDKAKIICIQKQYNNVLRFLYNRLFENNKLTTKQCIDLTKTLNNITIDTYFRNGALYEARSLLSKNSTKQLIFGGKKLFLKRQHNLISKEDFNIKKLFPIQIVGASYNKGNCKFQIIDETKILFKPSAKNHIYLNLTKQSRKSIKELLKLKQLQDDCFIPITYKLDSNFIYITFDYNRLYNKPNFVPISNRVFSIDINPNYIGYSVVDWYGEYKFKLVDKGVISIKPLNDKDFSLKNKSIPSESVIRKNITNKRNYETIKTAHHLIKLAKHFRCELFVAEDLNIKGSNKNLGKRFNKLCNNLWCRNKLYQQLHKYCSFIGIELIEVIPNYSSFIGNLVYRNLKLPDMILSSIEISRRGYEFYHQYALKDKLHQKNIILPKIEMVKNRIIQSLEELNCPVHFESLLELHSVMKKSKQKYRFLLEEVDKSRVSSVFYKKEYKVLYKFV